MKRRPTGRFSDPDFVLATVPIPEPADRYSIARRRSTA
jgi:hypothetical protein